MSIAVVKREDELINNPHYDRFKLQGENRFLVRVHKNEEYQSKGGVIIANTQQCQTIPTTGEVLKVSKNFDYDLYPDVKVGANVKVIINTWFDWDYGDEKLAIGSAEHIIAVYDEF